MPVERGHVAEVRGIGEPFREHFARARINVGNPHCFSASEFLDCEVETAIT